MTIARMLKRATGARAKFETQTSQSNETSSDLRKQRLESDAEIASYIAQMTAEMASIAGAARLDLLVYFLSLAQMEAETITRRPIMESLA